MIDAELNPSSEHRDVLARDLSQAIKHIEFMLQHFSKLDAFDISLAILKTRHASATRIPGQYQWSEEECAVVDYIESVFPDNLYVVSAIAQWRKAHPHIKTR